MSVELTPAMILAVSLAIESFTRMILGQIAAMTDEELDAFIIQKEAEKAEHDEWLKKQLGG
jgi:hypothetical protein